MEFDVVTGAYSFTGKYIARRLLALGRRVITLTGHPDRPDPFGGAVAAFPLRFTDRPALTARLEGAATLYNTYWIRFEHGETTFARTLDETAILLRAARRAGVRRIVHLSAVHADPGSPYPFFRAKGNAEELVRETALPHAILRPTLLFGEESIFLNNITWMLRHLPVFAIPGRDGGRLQPIFVDDVAAMAVDAGLTDGSPVLEAAGPEVFTFEEMVRLISRLIGSHARLLHFGAERTLQLSRLVGERMRDVVLTPDEIHGLLQGLLVATGTPAGRTRFSEWLPRHAAALGSTYISAIDRHYK